MQTMRTNSFHDVAHWAGEFPRETWYDRLLPPSDVTVLKPDGSPLMSVLRGVLTGDIYRAVYQAVAPLARSAPLKNRGVAAGNIKESDERELFSSVPRGGRLGKRTKARYQPVKRDGTVSNTVYGKDAPSFFLGASDRSSRYPYCRQTAYTAQYPERIQQLLPGLHLLNQIFAEVLPSRYAAQADAIRQIQPAWVFPGTVFTTATVNRNWQTALHTDKGDLAAGFGVMICLRAGTYTGGYYVMPEYRVAVDLQAGDVLLSDVHCLHGNTALVGDAIRYERMTVVCYYRERMQDCGTPAEELQRAKEKRGALYR